MNKLPNMRPSDMVNVEAVPRKGDASGIVTGTVLFRDQGPAPTGDGRKLVLMIGMLAVPADSKVFIGGRMTAIAELPLYGYPGFPPMGSDVMLGISHNTWAPFTKDGDGNVELVDVVKLTPDILVTLPIWRV